MLEIISRKDALARGQSRYFTGECCPNGHICERRVVNRGCVECARSRDKCRPPLSDEQKTAHNRRNRKYVAKPGNHARRLARQAEYRAENREEHLRRAANYREQNREKYNERLRDWWALHPEKKNAFTRKRRAIKKGAEGFHSADDIARIREAQRDRCGICRAKLRGKGHVDHIIPLSKGGSNWPSNLQLLCEGCNCSKHNRDPIEFMQLRGRLL